MKFLGTSAGEGIPAPFCECEICSNARTVGGKELRLRSSFRIDDKNIIDMGTDFHAQAALHRQSYAPIENIFFTHVHEDHFHYNIFWNRATPRKKLEKPLNIFVSEQGAAVFNDRFLGNKSRLGELPFTAREILKIHKTRFFEPIKLENFIVTPLKGRHTTNYEDNSSNYLFEFNNGKTMYYACDTGYYFEETFDFLKGKRLDLWISELTVPKLDAPYFPRTQGEYQHGHCDGFAFLDIADRLYKQSTIDSESAIYTTHISPRAMTHAQIEDFFKSLDKPYEVIPAYDGLEIKDF